LCRGVEVEGVVRVEEFYERVVYSGGCYATNGGENVFSDSFVRCALELTDCQAEESYHKYSIIMVFMSNYGPLL